MGVHRISSRFGGTAVCLFLPTLMVSNLLAQVGPPPMIVTQPMDQAVPLGGAAQFTVTVQSGTPVTYRWYLNGNLIPGQSTAALVVPNTHWGDQGRYAVAVQNAAGTVMSSPVALTVTNVPIRLAFAEFAPGSFSGRLSGPLSSKYVIEATSDCANWQPVSTNAAIGGYCEFIDRSALTCPTRIYRALLLESLLEQNIVGAEQQTLKTGSRGAQSFSQGAVGGSAYWIRSLVIYVPPPTTNQGPSLTLSIGTGLYSPPLPGSLVTVVPGAIAEQTNTTAFVPVSVRFLEPVGPLASGTTYYINMECNAATDGDPLILAGSAVDAYTKGTFNRDGNDLGRDLRFEIWGN